MRLLSVDWDYFFPDPIGGPMFYAGQPFADPKEMAFRVWLFRSKQYIARSATLPVTSGDENHFWERFRFAPDGRGIMGHNEQRPMVALSPIVPMGLVRALTTLLARIRSRTQSEA